MVTIRPAAYEMLDTIYEAICQRVIDNSRADDVISAIEAEILSLEELPARGSKVMTGLYANKGYRKL